MKVKEAISHSHPVRTPAQSLEESIHVANISAHRIGLTNLGVNIVHPRLNPTIEDFLHLFKKCALLNRVN